MGFDIPPNVFGPGLYVVHWGTITVSDAARVTGMNLLVDSRVNQKVSVVTKRPLSRSEYMEVFLSTLRANGLVAIPISGGYRIQPIEGAASQPTFNYDESRVGAASVRFTDTKAKIDETRPLAVVTPRIASITPTEAEREALARTIRSASQARKRGMPDPELWADVDPGAAVAWMRHHGAVRPTRNCGRAAPVAAATSACR